LLDGIDISHREDVLKSKAGKNMKIRSRSMGMQTKTTFTNSWDNGAIAASYAKLEFPNTYYLAYRDLPEIISRHIRGKKAVDFGCGTGRSTRFARMLGFETIGIDVSKHMISTASAIDPSGDYRLVNDGNYSHLGEGLYDLVLSVFTFDNIPGWENRCNILKSLGKLLSPEGRMICLDSTPELYTHEWASFTTRQFPENLKAKTGDIVRDIILDVEDQTPCEDIFWTSEDYNSLFNMAGFVIEAVYKPLGYDHEPFEWINEKEIAPWVIYVLR
jgi:2-polyprenyl-3-methyl-5-hydroxy-6-metoxy-1,4-benzoquinol methylase